MWRRRGFLLSSALVLLLVHGLNMLPIALARRETVVRCLAQCLCFIDTTATCNTNTLQVPCCWLKYPQLWWCLWRATRSPLQHIHSFPGGGLICWKSPFFMKSVRPVVQEITSDNRILQQAVSFGLCWCHHCDTSLWQTKPCPQGQFLTRALDLEWSLSQAGVLSLLLLQTPL